MSDQVMTRRRDAIPLALVKRYPMELIFLVLVAVLVATAPGFDTTGNLLNVLRTGSYLGEMAHVKASTRQSAATCNVSVPPSVSMFTSTLLNQ